MFDERKVNPLEIVRGVQETADALGFTYGLTHKLILRNEIPGKRIGGSSARCFTTSRAALDEYFKNSGLPKK